MSFKEEMVSVSPGEKVVSAVQASDQSKDDVLPRASKKRKEKLAFV